MNNFKVEYLENMKFVDWDNYEKSEMKDDCIKYIKDLQQRIDKAIGYIKENKYFLELPSYQDKLLEILKGSE